MTKEEAFEIKNLWEEIRNLEYLATDDPYHTLEFLAKRLNEAKKMDYPNTVSKLYEIKKQARRFIQTEITVLAKELNEKLETI